MTPVRRTWLSALVDLAIRCKPNRIDRDDLDKRIKQLSFKTDTSKMGLRFVRSLRDRLRTRWLKLKH